MSSFSQFIRQRWIMLVLLATVGLVVLRLNSLTPVHQQFEIQKARVTKTCTPMLGEITFSGQWLFAHGKDRSWAQIQADESSFQKVTVPSTWDEYGREAYRGHGWYRYHFDSPSPLPCTDLGLRIGPIRNTAEVFINGVQVAGFERFPFNLMSSPGTFFRKNIPVPASLLRTDGSKNVLSVHVYSQTLPGGIISGDVILADHKSASLSLDGMTQLLNSIPMILFVIAITAMLRFFSGVQENLSTLYFSLFALCGVFVTIQRSPYASDADMTPGVLIGLWFLGSHLLAISFNAFLHSHFEKRTPFWMWIPSITVTVLGLVGFFSGSLEVMAFCWTITLYVYPLVILHNLVVLTPALKSKKPGAKWLFVGNIIPVVTGSIELFFIQKHLEPPELFAIGMLLQALIILIASIQKDSQSERQALVLTRDLERRVEERTNALKEAMTGLEERNRDLDAFANRVAHDLKSPLVTITMLTEILEKESAIKGNQETMQTVQHINDGTERMSSLLEGVVRLARVGRKNKDADAIDFSIVVQETLQMLSAEIQEKSAIIHVEPGLPTVRGYKTDLTSLMLNLILNAIKHHGAGTPEIWIRRSTNREEENPNYPGRFFVICVEDNGPGVPKDDRTSIFLPFTRGAVPSTDGQGVGLAVVRRVVAQMGGSAWVSDSEQGGACFSVSLPTP